LFVHRALQQAMLARDLSCKGCLNTVETNFLWACLECTDIDALRCSRHVKGHSLLHFQKSQVCLRWTATVRACSTTVTAVSYVWLRFHSQHALSINLGSRMIWCYKCNAQVLDVVDAGVGTAGSGSVSAPRRLDDRSDVAMPVLDTDSKAGGLVTTAGDVPPQSAALWTPQELRALIADADGASSDHETDNDASSAASSSSSQHQNLSHQQQQSHKPAGADGDVDADSTGMYCQRLL